MIEKAFLATVLAYPESLHDVAGTVLPADFTDPRYQEIYTAVLGMAAKAKPIDALVLAEEMTASGTMAAAGGQGTILELMQDLASSPIMAAEYGRLIVAAATRREITKRLQVALEAAKNPERTLPEICGLAEAAALAGIDREGERHARQADSFLQEIFRDIEAQQKGELVGLPTGLKDLDEQMGGMEPGNFVILGGRPGTGKTSFAAQVLGHKALAGGVGIFFTGEMKAKEIARRWLTQLGRVNDQLLRTGKLANRDFPKLSLAAGQMKGARFILDDTTGVTPLQILSRSRRTKSKLGLDLIVVDNLQLMKGDGRYGGNRRLELQDVSNSMKRIAKDLHVPIMAISHLNRDSAKDNKPPSLHDLKECGDFEQDADAVMLMFRPPESMDPKSEDYGTLSINLAKLRNGLTGVVDIHFEATTTTFHNLAKSHQQEPRENRYNSNDGWA